MRLAIVGSIQLGASPEARRIIEDAIDRLRPTLVVSGGAAGIDTLAVTIAKEKGVETKEFLPAGKGWPFYKVRNLLIAQTCDHLIRVAYKHSRTYGSGWTRDRAAERGVPCEEFILESKT